MAKSKLKHLFEKEGQFERLKKNWAHYIQSPADYVDDVMLRPRKDGIKLLAYQADILDAIAKYDRVGVKAANGVGKDFVTACAIEWYLMTHPYAHIPCTSGVNRQIKNILFAEIHNLSGHSLMAPFMHLMDVAVRVKGEEKYWYAVGFTASAGESGQTPESKMEGFHGKNLLYVITEAKAVERPVWDAVKKACTGPGNKIFAQSVPGTEFGEFHKIFTHHRDSWNLYSFPAAKKVEGRYFPTTPIVSEVSIKEKLAEGEESPLFQASVLAQFVKQGDMSLIPMHWIKAAMAREPVADENDEVYFGVDVARYGDDKTIIAPRKGLSIAKLVKFSNVDTMTITDEIAAIFKATDARNVFVDVIGVGAGVVDRLLQIGVKCSGINVGEKARMEEKFADLRSELWFNLRELLNPSNGHEICLPEDETLATQLATIRYDEVGSGRIKVESKKRLKERGFGSPDEADAVCLAFFNVRPKNYFKKNLPEKPQIQIGSIKVPSGWIPTATSRDRSRYSPIMGLPR